VIAALGSAWRLVRRLAGLVAKAVAIVVAVALLAAAAYEQIGAWRDRRVLKQIGRSVDIGGRTLNLHCTGEGTPTVVFVSGRTGLGYVWTPTQVQPEFSLTARVAGVGGPPATICGAFTSRTPGGGARQWTRHASRSSRRDRHGRT
jgi:hypothetical protein